MHTGIGFWVTVILMAVFKCNARLQYALIEYTVRMRMKKERGSVDIGYDKVATWVTH